MEFLRNIGLNSSISLCIQNKSFISSKTFPKSTRPILIPRVCVSVYIFLIPISISYLSFHLEILRRLNFVFTDDIHIWHFRQWKIDFPSWLDLSLELKYSTRSFDRGIVSVKFFPPNFERKLGKIKFYRASKKLSNFSLRS